MKELKNICSDGQYMVNKLEECLQAYKAITYPKQLVKIKLKEA